MLCNNNNYNYGDDEATSSSCSSINKFLPTRELLLDDGQHVYTLHVSEEDFERAQTDLEFTQSLLMHAQCTSTNSRIASNTGVESEANENSQPQPHETNLQNESTTHKTTWEYNETLCLISAMETHLENLSHPRKKKTVFEDVSNDVCSNGFAVSAHQCSLKWKSLVRSYKICKDNKTRTGKGPSRFNFFNEIDNLLGDKPSNKCHHSLEASSSEANDLEISENTEGELADENMQHTQQSDTEEHEAFKTPEKGKRKRKCGDTEAQDKLFNLKQDEYKKRAERHKERCAIEKRKVELLEILIQSQKSRYARRVLAQNPMYFLMKVRFTIQGHPRFPTPIPTTPYLGPPLSPLLRPPT